MSPIVSRVGFNFGFGGRKKVGSKFSATGGNQAEATGYLSPNGYTYHVFTSPGTLTVSGTKQMDILLVAGGGAGAKGGPGGNGGGGGGAGGLVRNPSFTVSTGVYTITIGSGAGPRTFKGQGGSGGASSISPFPGFGPANGAVSGGGGGGGGDGPNAGAPGGSGGGGGSAVPQAGGSGISGQGYRGGNGGPPDVPIDQQFGPGGGGGGAGGIGGQAPPEWQSSGGAGVTYPEFSTPEIGVSGVPGSFSGGGGGARYQGPNLAPSFTGKGGGGGGAGNDPSENTNSGGGQPGIVIFRYLA